MNCPRCGSDNPGGAKFCRRCGAALAQQPPPPPVEAQKQFCERCGAPMRVGAAFCSKCGASQTQLSQTPPVPPPPAPPPPAPPPAPPEAAPPVETPPLRTGPGVGYYAKHTAWITLLVVSLLGGLAAAWIYDAGSPEVVAPPLPITPLPTSTPAIVLVDPALAVVQLDYTEEGRFGLLSTTGDPATDLDDDKLLTFNQQGETNNTRIWIDGATPIFGHAEAGGELREAPHWRDNVLRTLWVYDAIETLQEVGYTNGSNTGRADTIRIAYTLTNTAPITKDVGLRMMIDTLTGRNDGVPFVVPGRTGVTDAAVELSGGAVPDFIQTLEYADLANPGVIVNLTLSGADATPPDRVVISAWCTDDMEWEYLADYGGVGHPLTRCGVPGSEPDSAVGLYFDPKPLAPGASRAVVQYYGLGSISSTGSQDARLALSFNQSVMQDAVFWVTALVMSPAPGESLRLELPPELELVAGFQAEQPVVADAEFTQVSWQVRAKAPTEEAEVRVVLLPGNISEAQTIEVGETSVVH